MMKKDFDAVSFRDLEQDCEYRFMTGKPFWHLFTDGNKVDIIFSSVEDLKTGMNLLAVCCLRLPEVESFTFELMNNHLHIILSGDMDKCKELFEAFKSMLKRYFSRNGRIVDLKGFNCEMIQITSLQSLRNEIIYANRNGFVARPDCTPFSYPWGAGAWFFNPLLNLIPAKDYDKLTVKEKRAICHSNDIAIPSHDVKVYDGVILPISFCHIEKAEALFRNAHHYFQLLTRKFEAYSEIANRLHEKVFISDEEMYSAVCSLCMKFHNVRTPNQLGSRERIEMARKMRQDYNASNRQIKNILKLDSSIVDTLFPLPEH